MSVIEMKVPTIGESVTEVTLSQWLKADGDYVELDEPICEFESDKATLEFPAEAAGILKHVAAEDDDLEIGALVATINTSAARNDAITQDVSEKEEEVKLAEPAKEEGKEDKADKEGKEGKENKEDKETYASGHPSPAAAKTMRENNVDPKTVKGTGKDGRITQADAQAAQSSGTTATAPAVAAPEKVTSSAPESTTPATSFSRNTRREKMSRMRRAIAKNLVNTKNNTAMLTTFNEVDMSAIFALRKKYQERFVEKNGIKLGFMSLFTKACAKVLMEMPDVNAQLDGKEVIYHDFADISIAISTPTGLVVPPVRNAESMTFAEIEKTIKALATKARDGKLTMDEMSGGTFSITNGGIFGSMMSTPIINGSQSAILGMHNIVQRPMAIDGQVEIRPMMYLALSYDHRVIDGSTSVTFLVKVKNLLEDPVSLLLDL